MEEERGRSESSFFPFFSVFCGKEHASDTGVTVTNRTTLLCGVREMGHFAQFRNLQKIQLSISRHMYVITHMDHYTDS